MIIVGLLLLTIIIGGVSATEDIDDGDVSLAYEDGAISYDDSSLALASEDSAIDDSDSSIAVESETDGEDSYQEIVSETDGEDSYQEIGSNLDDDDYLKDGGSSNSEIINVTHGDEIVINHNDNIVIDITPDANGTLKVWIDEDTKLFDRFVSYDIFHDPYGEEDEPYYITLSLYNLTTSSSSAIHTLSYEFDSNMGKITGSSTFKLLYSLDIGVNDYPQFAIKDQRYGEGVTIYIRVPYSATGNVDFSLDGQAQSVAIEDGYAKTILNALAIGIHTISASYGDGSKFYELTNTTSFNVKPMIKFNSRDDLYPNNFLVDLKLPADANGKLVVFDYYTNVEFGSVDLKNGIAVLNLSCLPFGDHVLSAKYVGDDYEVEDTYRQIYTIQPLVDVPDGEKWNTKKCITFQVPSQATGKLSVTVDGKSISAPLTNGKASIKLSDFKPGNHKITFAYSDSYYGDFNESYDFEILPPAKIVAKDLNMSYYDGSYFKVTVYEEGGQIAKGVNVVFYVNGKKFKTVKTNSKGIAQFKVTQVPKTYKVTAKALGKSVTKKVTVKRILTLKAVTVKRSAKKLVLTATLKKVKGKYLKGKQITFKFNGKTYKAKTNKKGVAKVTIKKAVLKKLKKGKKVKYQATYVKDTVKRTAKVKK